MVLQCTVMAALYILRVHRDLLLLISPRKEVKILRIIVRSPVNKLKNI